MSMKLGWRVIGLVLSGTQVSFAQTFDFKGIVLGSEIDTKVLEEQHQIACSYTERTKRSICTGKTTFLGMDANLTVSVRDVVDNQGLVQSIDVFYQTSTVWPKDVAAELSKKFGPPKRQRHNMIFEWENPERHLAYLEHSRFAMKIPPVVKKQETPKINKKDL